MANQRGFFCSFESIDGLGKTTQLTESLSGDPCVIDRKPGVNVYRIYRVETAGKLVQA